VKSDSKKDCWEQKQKPNFMNGKGSHQCWNGNRSSTFVGSQQHKQRKSQTQVRKIEVAAFMAAAAAAAGAMGNLCRLVKMRDIEKVRQLQESVDTRFILLYYWLFHEQIDKLPNYVVLNLARSKDQRSY